MEEINQKQIFHGVDILKLFFAASIVFMHTYCWDFGQVGRMIVNMVSVLGVPFFFICSGFFLKSGLDRYDCIICKKEYYQRYVSRLLKMYLSWTILTLPIAIYLIIKAYPDSSMAFRFLYWIRMFILTGSIGVYWYVLALIICSFLIFYAEKNNLTFAIFIVSIIFFFWGELYNSDYNNGQYIYEWIHIVFSSTRNFLNTGLFYIFLGYYISKYNLVSVMKNNKWAIAMLLVISFVFRYWETSFLNTNFGVIILSLSFFLVAISVDCDFNTTYLRRLSVGLYMIHFPFILLFDYYLKKGTMIDFPVTLLFVFLIYFIINRLLPIKYSQVLLG